MVGLRGPAVSVRRTLPPGTSARNSATSPRGLAPDVPAANQESSNSIDRLIDKKMGCSTEHPRKSERKIYRFFAAFFFPPLAAFFAIVFSSGCCDSASDEPLGRHYGWAEPSTLIPDVDYV